MSDAAAMQARDTALFTLLYGCGLRIAEALALDVRDAPAPGTDAMLRVVGKGGKERIVPVLPAVREAVAAWLALHPDRQPDSPLFVGARGGRLDAAVAQRTLRQLPAAARAARARDAARAAALVRDASAGGRGGPAIDPGPAGPCQPVHHAALHRGGRGAAGGGMAQGASAGVTAKGRGRCRYSIWARSRCSIPVRHVEKVLGRIAEGDVTIACWEPGQTSPNHLHPNATEIYFCVEGGGVMRTPDATRGHHAGRVRRASAGRTARIQKRPGAHDPVPCALRRATSRHAPRTGRAIRTGARDRRTPRSSPKRADYCRTSSTRRFFALPSSVALSSTGLVSPKPAVARRAASMPCATSHAFTAAARSAESF